MKDTNDFVDYRGKYEGSAAPDQYAHVSPLLDMISYPDSGKALPALKVPKTRSRHSVAEMSRDWYAWQSYYITGLWLWEYRCWAWG